MKTLFLLLIFVISSAPILVEKSYGQTQPTISNYVITTAASGSTGEQIQNNTKIFVQIKLSDSAGRFVGYTEGNPQTIVNLNYILNWAQSHSQKSTITKEGKNFEIFKIEDTLPWKKVTAMGGYYFAAIDKDKTIAIMVFAFDSAPISPGDNARVTWTVVRSTS